MEINKISEEIKDHVRYNELDEAFEKLMALVMELKYSSFITSVELLQNRHQKNKQKFIADGKVAPEEENRITLGLIEILDDTLDRSKNTQAEIEARKAKELAAQQRIAELEKQIEDMVDAQLSDIVIPNNYQNEISREFKFSFCYPKGWSFQRFPQQVQYGSIIEQRPGSTEFNTNMNIVISDISAISTPLSILYEQGVQQILSVVSGAVLKSQKSFLYRGLEASKVRVDYKDRTGMELSLYQISVADKDRKRIFYVSFTCLTKKIEENILLFDNIMSTLRI